MSTAAVRGANTVLLARMSQVGEGSGQEAVAGEGGEADGACQRGRLAGTLYRPGDRQEGAGVEEVSGHCT